MKGWLLDTNFLSELKKGIKGNEGVRRWIAEHETDLLYVSVISLGEIRRGIEKVKRKESIRAFELGLWLTQIETEFETRILPIDRKCADIWGLISSHDPLPVADALIASTALEHGLTVVTRNEKDFTRLNVPMVNPFS